MWMGDSAGEAGLNTFDGFLKALTAFAASEEEDIHTFSYTSSELAAPEDAVELFDRLWNEADCRLQDLKAEGQLAFFATSDICHLYEKYLDSKGADASYIDTVNGRRTLAYHGIPVVDVRLGAYLADSTYPKSFCLLTDRRNLVLAVNTADFPGTEIRMWYNPDLMENRQRATFMAGCDILDETMLSYAWQKA